MANRARARELAAEHLAKGDATGWFERLYREAEAGKATVPWADLEPNLSLLEFWTAHSFSTTGKPALTVGCGLGDDAEQLANWGFTTTAFDISESTIAECKRRFGTRRVHYTVVDLLNPPAEWESAFDFVFEAYTLQVLPPGLRHLAIENTVKLVAPGGKLLIIARARDEQEPPAEMPWPLTRVEMREFDKLGLCEVSFEDYLDKENPPVRRFRALYEKSAAGD